jgi:hypothetical protein
MLARLDLRVPEVGNVPDTREMSLARERLCKQSSRIQSPSDTADALKEPAIQFVLGSEIHCLKS